MTETKITIDGQRPFPKRLAKYLSFEVGELYLWLEAQGVMKVPLAGPLVEDGLSWLSWWLFMACIPYVEE
jgi:hypothetical protein